jgi:hypothetical protein
MRAGGFLVLKGFRGLKVRFLLHHLVVRIAVTLDSVEAGSVRTVDSVSGVDSVDCNSVDSELTASVVESDDVSVVDSSWNCTGTEPNRSEIMAFANMFHQ